MVSPVCRRRCRPLCACRLPRVRQYRAKSTSKGSQAGVAELAEGGGGKVRGGGQLTLGD